MSQTMPILHPDEHTAIESFVGRELTNDEAQMLLRDATLEAAFNAWMDGKQ